MRVLIDIDLIPKDSMGTNAKEYVESVSKNLKVSKQITKENMQEAQEKYKTQHDKNACEPNYRLDQKVLKTVHKVQKGKSAKLTIRCDGP